MLTELHIENLGVIESVTLNFGPGFIVFTGETGAGKTMLVEAINLIVGARADASIVRSGCAEARVDGRFVVRKGEDDEEIVLSRVIPQDGRSRAYVNGRLATVSQLAEIGLGIVDIHGQHAHQRLLSVTTQREALDRFGGVDLSDLRAARAELTQIEASLAAMGGDERSRAREIDLLQFQVNEIESANIVGADEDAELKSEQDALSSVAEHRESLWRVVDALTRDGGALDAARVGLSALAQRSSLSNLSGQLTNAVAEIEDVAVQARELAERTEEDPERLSLIGERRQLLRDLMRKYGESLNDVLAYGVDARARLEELESWEYRARSLEEARGRAEAEVLKQAGMVRSAREKAAPLLASAVQDRMAGLAMEHAVIDIDFGDRQSDPAGDAVMFLLAANPGSPLLPLTRVASGGELARTMLALRLVLADDPGALVFDEVDAGIGGSAAVTVAQAMAELGQSHQVFAVTHLPQVAAAASTHVHVSKSVERGATFGAARVLSASERVVEVARMLSGGIADDEAREHASRLLQELASPKTSSSTGSKRPRRSSATS